MSQHNMQESADDSKTNRTRRRVLTATASAGAGGLIVPTVGAQESSQRETASEDPPDWLTVNPGNEVEIVEANRTVPSSNKSGKKASAQNHENTPDATYGKTVKVGKRTIGLDIIVYDAENAACNWGIEAGVGFASASGDRIHCEGSNSISVSPGPATVTLAAEPLSGTVADEGMTLTGEICVGEWVFETCDSVDWDIEFP